MNPLDVGLRASVVVLVALTASAALHRRSAALRHWVLAAGILSAAAVAPLGFALPAWNLPAPPPTIEAPLMVTSEALAPRVREGGWSASPAVKAPVTSARVSVEQVASGVWAAGFVVSAIMMLVSVIRLARVTSEASPVSDPRFMALARELSASLGVGTAVSLVETGLPNMLGTWGWRRPSVLLPAHCDTWRDSRIRIVLGHELAHIGRADWAIQIAAELVRAAFWYNPLFWIACARLRRESEQACDNAVLEAGVPAADYASHLLAIARTCRAPSPLAMLVPMARPSTLEWRIAAMLNHTLARTRPTRRTLALVFAVIVGVTLTTATFRAREQVGPLPLTGTAYDTTGAVLPGVALTLDDATGSGKTVTTDSTGRFDFGAVAPGRYLIGSNLPGFLPFKQQLMLENARQFELALTLQVGTLQETVTVTDQRPSGVPARVERAPVRIGGNIRPPRKLVNVQPVYPESMRDAGLEGVVPLGALIGADGTVTSVRVTGAQVHPELARAAADAVRQWRFSPTLLNGEAVEVFMSVAVVFSLQD